MVSDTFAGERKCQFLEGPKVKKIAVIKAHNWLDYHRMVQGGVDPDYIIKPEMVDSKLAAYWRSC